MAHWASTTNRVLEPGCASHDEWNLARAARQGDKSAFQQLIFRYDRLVLTFALNVTRSEEDARYIYQRVFLRAFNSLSSETVECSLFVWIYRIAADCCQQFLSSGEKFDPVVRSTSPSHGASASLTNHSDRPGHLLSQLSVRERLVFVLAHHGRLRARTIAEILKIPEDSVKDALLRAIYKLRNSMNESA